MKDIVASKGPDIFVTRRGSLGPHRPVWSKWNNVPWQNNLGYLYENGNLVPGANRRGKIYNFKTRRYEHWTPGAWSDVKRSKYDGQVLYYRDAYGDEFVNNIGMGPWENPYFRNPYAYSEANVHGEWEWDEPEP